MIKLKPKIYAQALYLACQETAEIDLTLHNFFKLLAKHNRLGLLKAVIKEFIEIYNKEKSITDVYVSSAYALDNKSKEAIVDLVKQIKPVKQVEISETIEPDMLGGVKINFADFRIDATLKRKLQLIKNNFNK